MKIILQYIIGVCNYNCIFVYLMKNKKIEKKKKKERNDDQSDLQQIYKKFKNNQEICQ